MFVESYAKEIEKVTPEDVGRERAGGEASAKSDFAELAVSDDDWENSRVKRGAAGELKDEQFPIERVKSDSERQLPFE